MRDLLPTGVPSLIALANNPFFSTLAKYHLLSVQSHYKRANRIPYNLFQSFSSEFEAHLDMEKKGGESRETSPHRCGFESDRACFQSNLIPIGYFLFL